jgi:hypothetical protein
MGGKMKALERRNDALEQALEPAHQHRLVACWNACEGINPEAVPELLKAARAVVAADDAEGRPNIEYALDQLIHAVDKIRAALAKAEEK